jgi:hypothetical protein
MEIITISERSYHKALYLVISKYILFAVVSSFKTCMISPARFLPLIRTISLSAQTEHLGFLCT